MVNSNLAQTGYENYYQMLSDNVRMEAYRRAIFKTVNPGDIVVDLGAGTGLLGIWALQAGAAKVYVIEKTTAIELAKEVARVNNFSDKMVFIQENSMDVELPEKANVLLSETLGSFAVDENTLQFTQDAKDRFLLEQGSLIPRSIDLFVAPIEDAETYQKIDFWRHIPDIDFTPAFNLFTKKIMVELVNPDGFLAQPVKLCHIDLTRPVSRVFQSRQYIKIDRPGTIHGVAGWFHAELCDGIAINTAPDKPHTHWKQAFFPFENVIEVIVGDVLDWSVQVGAKQENSDDTQITYNYRCTQLKNEPRPFDSPAIGRNDKCPCGSGKKFKKCCMG